MTTVLCNCFSWRNFERSKRKRPPEGDRDQNQYQYPPQPPQHPASCFEFSTGGRHPAVIGVVTVTIRWEQNLLARMTDATELAKVVESRLQSVVFEEPICGAAFDWIVGDFWLNQTGEDRRAPTLGVIDHEFPGLKEKLPDLASVEEPTEWLMETLNTRYAKNKTQEILRAGAITQDDDPLGTLRTLVASGQKALDATAIGQAALLDRLSVDGEWLDAQEFPDLEYVVPGLISEGAGVLAGGPKRGKSFLVGNIGLAVAQGGMALGAIPVKQRPVLYLALEDGHMRLQGRLRSMNSGQPIPKELTLITKANPQEAMAVITEYLRRHGAAKPLVILDTLGKVKRPKRPGEESYQVDYAMGDQLKALADTAPGCCILVVHHTRKAAAEDFIDTLSGTQGIAGSVDFILVLDRKRGHNDAILKVVGRDIIEGEYALHADPGMLWRLAGDDLITANAAAEEQRAQARLGENSQRVLTFVNSRQQTIAADVMQALGIDRKRATEILSRLFDSDRIAKPAHGVYTPHATMSLTADNAVTSDLCCNTQVDSGFRNPHQEKASADNAAMYNTSQKPCEPEHLDTGSSEGKSALSALSAQTALSALSALHTPNPENNHQPSSDSFSGENSSGAVDFDALKRRLVSKHQKKEGQ